MSVTPNPSQADDNKMPAAGTGNASNPPLKEDDFKPTNNNQLIDERGEKYLREVAPIEDYPDSQDDQDMDETIKSVNQDQ